MAYNGNYTSDLDATKPLGTESPVIADDALREIKRAMKNDIPPLQTDVSTLKNTTVPGIQSSITNIQNVTVPALQQADTNLQNNINGVFNQTVYVPGSNDTQFSFVVAQQTTGINTAANTPYTIPFNNELADFKNEFNPSTGLFTASAGGLYWVSFFLRTTTAENNWMVGRVLYNNVEIARDAKVIPSGANTGYLNMSLGVKLNAGDNIRCTAEMTVSGWITENNTKFYIIRVH